MNNRYIILTNDTEALPNRATEDHVRRLMWGEHGNGVAGVREMASIVKEFNGKITYFVDMCGALDRKNEVLEVAKWLNDNGQDVELHLHPEYLPADFWDKLGMRSKPTWLNEYQEQDRDRLRYLIKTFSSELESAIGRKIIAYRAGSFRWNSITLEVLKELGIPLSFNNTQASVAEGQCPYASSMQKPFRWSNGIIEVPVTERNFFAGFKNDWWVRYQYPLCSLVRYRRGPLSFIPYSVSPKDDFLVCLMHSWSFLYRDENGYEYYKDDRYQNDFRKMLQKISKDFDIIDSRDLKDLIDTGKIQIDHTEDISKTVYVPRSLNRECLTREKVKALNSMYIGKMDKSPSESGIEEERFYDGFERCLLPQAVSKYIQSKENSELYRFTVEEHEEGSLLIKNRFTNKIDGKQYIPVEVRFDIKDFMLFGKLPVNVSVDSEQEIKYAIIFYDENGLNISSNLCSCNCNIALDVPEGARSFSLYFRVPEGFKYLKLKYISFTLVDSVSTHIYPIDGNEKNGYFRLSVHNLDKKDNGVVIVFPANLGLYRGKYFRYPNYSVYKNSKIEDVISDCTVIYVCEPYPDMQLKYTGSWFFNRNGRFVLPQLVQNIKSLLGDKHGKILCSGFCMGAEMALYFSYLIKADFCICDNIHAQLYPYRFFKRLYREMSSELAEIITGPDKVMTILDRKLHNISRFIAANQTDDSKEVYFYFYTGNVFYDVLCRELACLPEGERGKKEFKVEKREHPDNKFYDPMPADELTGIMKKCFCIKG